MGPRVQQFWLLVFFLLATASPAFAQSPGLPHEDIREFLPPFLRDTARAIDDQIRDKTQFVKDVFDYKRAADTKITEVLDDLSSIIRDYAENTQGLEKSADQLIKDLNRFSGQFRIVPSDFPAWDEVQRIVQPHLDHLTAVLQNEFPVLGPMPAQGFPLGNFYDFFTEAERRNSFGTGAFFRIEPLKPQTIRRTYVSRINYVTEGGVEREEVVYEESQTFEDDNPVAHRVVENDRVVLNEAHREDFSVLHGLPAAMRQAGVNESFIRLVEEYIKLVNYHLIANYRDRGLIIPADHPQLQVPPGYTPETFVRNFIALIVAIQAPPPSR